jgi:hypothetical protein
VSTASASVWDPKVELKRFPFRTADQNKARSVTIQISGSQLFSKLQVSQFNGSEKYERSCQYAVIPVLTGG